MRTSLLGVLVLAIACSPKAPPITTQPAASTPSATIEGRADAFVEALRNNGALEQYLAPQVAIRFRSAPDEPKRAAEPLAASAAAKRLTDPIERFLVGDKRECDATCCRYDTKFVRGDMTSAVAAICFESNAIATIEAE